MPTRGYTNPSGRVSLYDPSLNPTHTTSLWRSAPLAEWLHDRSIGTLLDEQWHTYDAGATAGDYVLTQATTGAAAISTAAPGVLELDSDSTTATQGVQIQRAKSSFVPVAGSDIWAEFEFKIVDTFDKAEVFVGLSEVDTTIIASSANSSANHIGWEITNDDGVLLFCGEKAGARGTAAAATIAEDTYIRLGFYVSGVTSIQQYVNGVATGSALATANVPVVRLVPSFACQSGGTNDPIMHLRSYRILQTYAR